MKNLPAPTQKEFLGPAMSKLNLRRQAFVRAYVARGRRNASAAYKDAGYTCANDSVAAVNGCLLLHNEFVQEAIKEYCLKQLVALGPVSIGVAGEMLENPQTDPSVRAKLVTAIWDRTGLAAKTEHKVTVEHIGDDPRALAEARSLVSSLGLSDHQIQNLLGRTMAGKVVDAEYEDVTEEPGGQGSTADPPESETFIEVVQEEEIRW